MQNTKEKISQLFADIQISSNTEKLIQDNLQFYKDQIIGLFKIDDSLDTQTTELGKKRLNIYSSYKDNISKFIDKYEIRNHDLPEIILEMLNDLVDEYSYSFREDIVKEEDRLRHINRAVKIEGCLGYCVCGLLVKSYLKVLKGYKKTFSLLDNANIKYKETQQPYYQHLKEEIAIIRKIYKVGEKQYKKFFIKNKGLKYNFELIKLKIAAFFNPKNKSKIKLLKSKKGIQYNFELISSVTNFDDAINRCETLLKEIEGEKKNPNEEARTGYFSELLNEGGKSSIKTKIIKFFINIGIPLALAIIAAILWANKLIKLF